MQSSIRIAFALAVLGFVAACAPKAPEPVYAPEPVQPEPAFTGKLCLTVSLPVADQNDKITGVLGADIRFEELLKRQSDLEYANDLGQMD